MNASRSPSSTAYDVADLQLGAMVVHHGVGVQHVGADLAAEVDVLLGPSDRRVLGAFLLLQVEEEPRAQNPHREFAVAMLAALGLGLHHQAGGQVR